MIVCDSSPLIFLTKIDKLQYVFPLFGKILIPQSVYKEVVEKGQEKGYIDAQWIDNAIKTQKIECISISPPDQSMNSFLHEGERDAILLAKERDTLVILDEQKGRIIAQRLHLKYHGTLGILLILLTEKIINGTQYLHNLQKFSELGWISPKLYEIYRQLGDKFE